jgi:AcrR family transcriptional regulator
MPEQNPPMRRPGGRSAQIRARVLEAVLLELTEFGYQALSLERVAARANVHRTTVYRRWSSKDYLLLDAVSERAAVTVTIPDSGFALEDLTALAVRVGETFSAPEIAALVRAFIAEPASSSPIAALGHQFLTERLQTDRTVVQRAIDRGELVSATDPGTLIETLLGAVFFRLFALREPVGEEFANQVASIVLNGSRNASPDR